jgi:Protein of unknown function (DUF2924)
MKAKVVAISTIAREIEALYETPLSDLKDRWRTLYRTDPPPRISRDLIVRAVAYRIQEKALGGVKPSSCRLLTRVAADASARRPIAATAQPALKPGTVLLREWRGSEHKVFVREDGIRFNGKSYKSLSEVARRITGTNWSGPLFFGLKQRRLERSHGSE